MARTDSLEHFLTDAAAAIRLKCGTSAQMNSNEMINTLNNISEEMISSYITQPVYQDGWEKGYAINTTYAFFNSIPNGLWESICNQSIIYNLSFAEWTGLQSFENYITPITTSVRNFNFKQCYNIRTINLSGITNYTPVSWENSFYDCFNVTSITLPFNGDFPFENGRGTFQNCYNLSSIVGIENLKLNNNTRLYGTFENCKKLNFNFLSSWDLFNIGDLNNAFKYSNLHLNDLKYFSNIQMPVCTDVSNAFSGSNIENLIDLNLNFCNAKNSSHLFYNIQILQQINNCTIDLSQSNDASWMFGIFYNLTYADLSNFYMNNVKNCSYMFFKCNNLENFSSQRKIFESPINLSHMFDGCNNLINLPGGLFWHSVDWSNVNNIAQMFAHCNNMSHLSISWALYLINSINIQKIPASSKNLSQGNFYSPFYSTNINVNNVDFLDELAMSGGAFDHEVWMSLINAGWNGIANLSEQPGK